ncbi:unnamed protein product, partial [Polarella glacialis]
KPAERPSMEKTFGRGLPGQYLHKGVLLLVKEWSPDALREPVLLVLLNGPEVGMIESEKAPVFFGGPSQLGNQGVFELRGNMPYRFQGVIPVDGGNFLELLEMGAFEVTQTRVALDELLAAPVAERWQIAGGKIDSLKEAATAKLGDVQQKMWYKRFFDIDFPQ